MGISGVIVAGGVSSRMAGVDKAMVTLGDMPLIGHVIQRLSPQVDEIIINANTDYNLGYPVVADDLPFEHIGPLAGILAGLNYARYNYILTVPCDTPLIPAHLVQSLYQALIQQNVRLAFAQTASGTHPIICLYERAVRVHLQAFIRRGGRKIYAWHQLLPHVAVDFDDDRAFSNINSPQELCQLEP